MLNATVGLLLKLTCTGTRNAANAGHKFTVGNRHMKLKGCLLKINLNLITMDRNNRQVVS